MPIHGRISERANEQFNSKNIGGVAPSALGKGNSLGNLARTLGLAPKNYEVEYLDSWPAALQEAIRATLESAVDRDPRVPVQVTWTAGYDFSVLVAEAMSVGDSAAQITIQLRSPYPEPSETQD